MLPSLWGLTPADSARAVGDVYGVSLLATVPLLLAVGALVVLRRAGAGTRVLIWRWCVVVTLAAWFGRLLPVHWVAWVVPTGLAAPFVALGRAQLGGPGGLSYEIGAASGGALFRWLLVVYWAGVVMVLLPMLVARLRLARLLAKATPLVGEHWTTVLARARCGAGVGRSVRLVASGVARVPMTWGTLHPVIVLPSGASHWAPSQRHAAVLHELMHVKTGDALYCVLMRLACALFWFHPGVWWMAARFANDAELACDDRVLLAGVHRSDYAELLALALGAARGVRASGALALVRRRGLRQRLTAIVDTSRVLRAPSRAATALAALLTAGAALPMSTVRVAPTRDVLTTLMRDARWESRAYAVVRLAQRRDSVEVARNAARHDPSASVRAWAQYALAQGSADTLEATSRSGQFPALRP